MGRKDFPEMNCSIARTLGVVGERWNMLVIRDAFLGVTRFDEFQARLKISRNILSDRLDQLVQRGILERLPYQEHPVRYDYVLTDKGRDLWPVITTMRQWADRWEAPDGPPVVAEHDGCGHALEVGLVCEHCGERLDRASVTLRRGPGARPGQFPIPIPVA